MTSKRVATTRPEQRRGMTKGQIRAERRSRSQARRRRRRAMIIGGAGFLAVLLIGSVLVGPGFRNSLQGSGASAPGSFNTGGPAPLSPNDGAGHIPVGGSHAPYSTVPATSGLHWFTAPGTPLAPLGSPVRWGVYDEVIPDEALVHNLEHGGVGLHYDCPEGCPEIVQALEDLVPSNPYQMVLSPYRGLPQTIAITAWQHVIYLDEVDEDQILDFIDAYQNRAAEPGTYPF